MTFNGLSVVEDGDTDVVLEKHLDRAKKIMNEVIGAANANGVEIPESFAEGLISFTEKMNGYAPSMRYDYLNGQALEIEYLYERPIAVALKHDFKMPETEILYEQLREIARLKKTR